MSVRQSAWNNSAPTGWILLKYDTWVFFEKLPNKIQVSLKSETNIEYFTWKLIYIFYHISLSSS